MSDRLPIQPEPSRFRWPLVVIIVVALFVFAWLRLQGLLLLLPILAIAALLLWKRPNSTETDSLRTSIALSADDIRDVIAEYEHFSTSPDADALADRTLHRPALADHYCDDPAIESFHHQSSTARRYLSRLEARLANRDLEVGQLENLLNVTDERALEIKNAWLEARHAAKRLGPNY
ncbi:hypothetical protein HCH15_04285 [Corynebacterium testudinoris]|uniref:Uncharacterized protein n=1 Tax=Corynebacterium testudinoris TaxID=136857 RepID=A0A0G3H6G2_9CORY|nr:hypothetical protein CTEST_07805 [Corynebacterium testudinoris]MBX8995396.1 hypothetical protein [Corynebacterium testudinoris]